MRANYLLTAVILLASPSLAKSTWVVDDSAPSGGDGSPGAPYDSIQLAVDAATTQSGDTLRILDGVYVELVHVDGKALTFDCRPDVSLKRPAGTGGPLIDLANVSPGTFLIDGLKMPETSDQDTHPAIRASDCVRVALRDCAITDHGRAVECAGSQPTTLIVAGSTIESCGDWDSLLGGTIQLKGGDTLIASQLTVSECIGPVIDGTYSTTVDCSDSSFVDNLSDFVTSVCSIPQARFTRCTFRSNMTMDLFTARGGALQDAEAIHCLFEENVANGESGSFGGAMYGGSALNCTFYRNTLAESGFFGGYEALDGSLGDVRNCVFYDDATNVPSSYCLANSGALPAGNGNILGTDPSFVDIVSSPRDFRLRADSPCVDSGDPAQLDPDGSRRDMGCYPFEPLTYCTAMPTSLGLMPRIGASGAARLSGPDDYHVTGDDLVPSQAAILLRGVSEADKPFYGRSLCVQPPVTRTVVAQIDATGHVEYFLSQAEMVAQGLSAYDELYWQWWFRDPADPYFVGLTCGLADVLRP